MLCTVEYRRISVEMREGVEKEDFQSVDNEIDWSSHQMINFWLRDPSTVVFQHYFWCTKKHSLSFSKLLKPISVVAFQPRLLAIIPKIKPFIYITKNISLSSTSHISEHPILVSNIQHGHSIFIRPWKLKFQMVDINFQWLS